MVCARICDLPDFLLTQILLNLPTKDSVKTSVLSTRWRNLWLSVPGLDIVTSDFPSEEVYASFIDRFMEFNQGSCLHIVRQRDYYRHQTQHSYNLDRLMELISTVADRGIQHLNVSTYPASRYAFMRQNIYKSKTLVSLTLSYIELKNPEFTVSLPCLKIMKLLEVFYGKDGPLIVEKLILGSPVLEDLQLLRTFVSLNEELVLFLRVRSQTLKRCSLGFPIKWYRTDVTVEIDAPRLEYLSLAETQSDRIVVKNLSSLLMINFGFRYGSHLRAEDLGKRHIFCCFLTRISSVRHMVIRQWTLEVFYSYSKLGPIPKFNNLYHLQADFSRSSLQLVLAFLESCPNLKNLILGFCYSKEPTHIGFTNVPRCLISTLEYVKVKICKIKDENETNVVNYFLENSAVLKKLTVSFIHTSITKQELENYKKLLPSTKLSPTCQVVIESLVADDEHMT